MSVLIKGMEMPKSCAECERWSICKCLNDFEDYESICYAVEDGDLVRDTNCPLIELPPHGRLIDADALRAGMYHEAFETDSELQRWDSGCWVRYKMFENHMDNAPTIIEAEE